METVFPFGFPSATAFYLVLYVLTFALHQAFMHYVLAGSIYVAWATIFPGGAEVPRLKQPLASVLRDWMPFMLSAAITAGVAPLLFVQIVYPLQFYTANLLLGWRWMVVIPVLIAGFYLLYVVKSSALSAWSFALRTMIVMLVAACFLFVGFCWTANHLLAADEANWPEVYATGSTMLSPLLVALRMLVWIAGSFASMTVIAGWQLLCRRQSFDSEQVAVAFRRLAWCGIGSAVVASGSAIGYSSLSGTASLAFGAAALPFTSLAIIGAIVQCVAWLLTLRQGMNRWCVVAASAGWVLSLLGVSVVRELFRLQAIDFSTLVERHQQAAEVGGFGVFLIFAVLNTLLITACIWLVRRSLRAAEEK